MKGFVIALIPPILWAVSNYVDKYLLNRFFKNTEGGPLIVLTGLVAGIIFPFILIFNFQSVSLGGISILVMMASGCLTMLCYLFYFYALRDDDVGVVVPLFQIIPVFAYFLGLIFLKETLTLTQIGAALLIILAAVGISLDLNGKSPRLKGKVFGWMLLSSFVFALNLLLFKLIAVEENFWGSVFWQYIGSFIFSIFILIFAPGWRRQLILVFKENRLQAITVNLIGELTGFAATLVYNFALLLMPIAIVSVIGNGLQPFFILILGFFITIFWPKFHKETLTTKNMIQRFVMVALMFVGLYFLNIAY